MLITSFLQIVTSLNLGLGESLVKFISQSRLPSDRRYIDNIVSTALFVTLCVSAIIVFVTFTATFLFDPGDMVQIPAGYEGIAMQSFRIVLLLFVLKLFDVLLVSIFQGFNRYDVAALLNTFNKVAILVVNILMALGGANLYEVLVSTIVVQCLYAVVQIVVVKRQYSFISLMPRFDGKVQQEMMRFGLWTWLQSVVAMVTIQIDKIIVAGFSGLDVLAYYSIASTVAIQLHTIFIAVSGWVFPAVSARSQQKENLQNLFQQANASLLAFGFVCIGGLLILREPLFTLWLGQETYLNSIEYIQMFLIYNTFLLHFIIPHFFLNGTGHIKYNTALEFTLKALNILLMIVFYLWFGNIGLVWGILFSTALVLPAKVYVAKLFALSTKDRFFSIYHLVPCIAFGGIFLSSSWPVSIGSFIVFAISFYVIHLMNLSSTFPSLIRNFRSR